MRILLTGATGHIGGRLAPALLADHHQVRCFTRSPSKLDKKPWRHQVEVAKGDVLDQAAIARALNGIDVAYYLVHALGTDGQFEERDRRAAEIFSAAAEQAGVRRIIYLGGLAQSDQPLSPHLRSRNEVGSVLLASNVPTIVLRAAMVIGSGSISFEMLRYLTERLPIMTAPRWVQTCIQPIAIRDVVHYLTACASILPAGINRSFDIGGPDVLTYAEMMQRYAAVSGLPKRLILRVPALTPRLSSYWIGLVTPVPKDIARPLIESLRNEVVCTEHDIAHYVPDPPEGLLSFDDAVRLALARIREAEVASRWSNNALPTAPSHPLPSDPPWAGGTLYVDHRHTVVGADQDALWDVVEAISGENGWYSWPLAWTIRGWFDRILGGVGLQRGRRDPRRLRVGESLDFWRVEEIRPGHLLRLRAEMKMPGAAWMELSVKPRNGELNGTSELHQRAIFAPRGLAGHIYWRVLTPFHWVVFGGMLRNVAHSAERAESK